MQVRAIRNKFESRPEAIAAFGSPESDTDISIGKEYEVYAMSVFRGVVFLQIVTDVNIITWLPAWFFEVSDPSVPNNWICSLLTGDLQVVLGPDFVAADEASYKRMVELDLESVAAFWRRLEANAQTGE
jgi:hypothetical protein